MKQTHKRTIPLVYCIFASFFLIGVSCSSDMSLRKTVRLDGQWMIAKTNGERPDAYLSTVRLPGYVDLAVPSLDPAETVYPDGWYWYQRMFDLSNINYDKIELKIFKAKYHTKVFINGRFVGENPYCFTPSYFDIKPYLLPAGQPNEIVIGVGCKPQLPDTIPDGVDFMEKVKYIPGIYDHVEITLSNKPYINNIQCVPDIVNNRLRVVAEIETVVSNGFDLTYRINEVASGKTVAFQKIRPVTTLEKDFVKVDFEIEMKDVTLWSPESPFLYELMLSTGADDKHVKFGMRSFRFDAEKKIALLNEKPYYMRGTNICFFRFEEDQERSFLPWEHQWPVTLHERFKDMHFNSIRYCIGFPPERWYEISDSLGFLLQDEYPIWAFNVNFKPNVTAAHYAEEYTRWMRERWNHPSVVIWDAQNETISEETGKAIRMVRGLDLSDRPWENGYSPPDRATDPVESHPYYFHKYAPENVFEPEQGYKKEFFDTIRNPFNDVNDFLPVEAKNAGVNYDNPRIINEYCALFLNRDGSYVMFNRFFDVLWEGKHQTAQQRFELWGRVLAAKTEYWRAHRRAAGLLYFCGLAYDRPNGPQNWTCDNWMDVPNLTFEPTFYKYVKPAFAPVGLMIDIWEKDYPAGAKINVPVFVVNDLEQPFSEDIQLSLWLDEQLVSTAIKKATVGPYEVITVDYEVAIPDQVGDYLMKAEYTLKGENVFCVRDIPVK